MTVFPKVDIVTVGAGWTAGIIAQQLTAKGHRVVSIEAGGDRFANPDFAHNHDSLYHSLRTGLMFNLSKETWTWRPNPRMPSLPIRQYGSFHPGVGIGGAGIHWAAQTWRFYPTDFRYRSHHIERYGEARIPEGCTVQDWGLAYEELEPFYTQADYEIGISGQTGNLNGAILQGGNPFEGNRSRPYPLPPLFRSMPAEMFGEAAQGLGYHPFPQPASILSRAYRDVSGRERAACVYCGFCTRYGCEVDAKASANVSHIPLALDTGLYEIRTYSKVINVNLNSDGLATGVTYVDLRTGQTHEQPAEVVILSGFTLTNVRLLLLSRNEVHPEGIGNDQGMVGKNYSYQLNKTPANGIFEGRRFNSYMGNSCLQNVIEDFNADNFDHSELDFIGGASITCGGGEREPIASAHNLQASGGNTSPAASDEEKPVREHLPLPSEFGSLIGASKQWGREWKENLRKNWDSTISIGIQGESLPYEDQFLDLDPTYKDAMGLPLLRVTFEFHENDARLYRFVAAKVKDIMRAMGPTHMDTTDELAPYNIYSYQSTHNTGGAIMGTSPSHSVTNKYGQVWDTPNVFVTGAALFPQNAGLNPTGTVMALAYFASAGLKNTYFQNPNEVMS
ncbi:MAG: GMC family oxidoreductase [Chloroflexi bacterium]|nr:GMC family oxidoreductase [Chloroflexota bacterium]MCC6896488.1 GMC family oxidoreductase [Anaerolineae bacterium]